MVRATDAMWSYSSFRLNEIESGVADRRRANALLLIDARSKYRLRRLTRPPCGKVGPKRDDRKTPEYEPVDQFEQVDASFGQPESRPLTA